MNDIQNQNFQHWLVRGDCHGQFTWINTNLNNYEPEKTAIIILGDAGFNFWLSKTERRHKKEINDKGYTFYVVRGNHECRPQDLEDIEKVYDYNVHGFIYVEPDFPNIRYFKDYGDYVINRYYCYVIGGAYSVDKWYRLERVGMTEETNIPTRSGWFANEQLTSDEMNSAEWEIDMILSTGKKFDFILSHTCPYSLRPTDMFLSGIDQSKVDSSMELWMDKIYQKNRDNSIWLWGHYHRDSIEAPHCEMYYNDIEELDTIAARWDKYDETGKLDWWLVKSPYFEERWKLWWLVKDPFFDERKS